VLGRVAKVVLGLLLVVGGALFGALPVLPGWPLVLLGIALVLSQSEPGRRTLTRLRLWARHRFEPDRVRDVERRLPREVIGDQNTTQMRLDLVEHERRRQERRRRRREGDG
jgi:hypothetical protein